MVPKLGGKQTKAQSAASDVDSDEPSPVKKPKKKVKTLKEPVELDLNRKLVLMIPQASSERTQRENLKHSTSFEDALIVIYDTIGCANVSKKLTLSYKLSNAPGKASAINLGSLTDWEGCLEEVTEAESKKNAKISVLIIVTDIYMNSLCIILGTKTAGRKQKKKGKLPVLDLEHTGSGDDDFDDGLSIMESP
ncbi:hypothetical protein DFH07DRAFT_961929 [Mycena maculata]|uniref:Uncharacterized protein n=1 Tax=Mycena maculata TaxID=230809 RepID=A0AAD7N7N3_9AGAR|nr:hypothetical protein DFH07DRAFT_961929 [Mycena maculata]